MSKSERAETQKINFTKGAIERLKAPSEGRTIIYDVQVPGLGIQVMPSGKKTFFWFRFAHAKPVWRSLGEWPALSLEDARAAGGDRNTQRERWKASGYLGPSPFAKASGALTLGVLKDAYVEQHLREHSARPMVAERELRYLFDKHLAAWKDRAVGEIQSEEIALLHRKVGAKHQRTANVLVKTLSVLYHFGERAHLWKGELPTKGVQLYHERKRSRYLAKHELPKLFAALSKVPNVDLQHYVLFSLFCGTRKSDTLSMRWSDIDLDAARWTIPNPTKSREPRTVVLTSETLSVLRDRMKLRIEGSDFVFPSIGKTGHVMDLKGAWKKLLVSAGLYSSDAEVRVKQHDLRRSFAANLAMNGAPLLVVARALGHMNSASVTELYARISDDVVREAMTESNKLMRAAMRKKVKAAPVLKLLKPAPSAPRPKVAARA